MAEISFSDVLMTVLGCYLIAYTTWDVTIRHYRDTVKELSAENAALKQELEQMKKERT